MRESDVYFARRRDNWLQRARMARKAGRPTDVKAFIRAARFSHWQYLRAHRGDAVWRITGNGKREATPR